MVGELNAEKYQYPKIIYSDVIKEGCAETIFLIIEKILEPILENNLYSQNFKLIVTDGAEVCNAIGRKIKFKHNNVKHLVCLCHNLHNLAQTINTNHPTINKLKLFIS